MSGSFSFGGTALSAFGLYIKSIDRASIASIVSYEQKVAGKHGSFDFTPDLSTRPIDLDCVVIGTSHSDLLSKLDNINSVINPLVGTRQLIFDTQTDRYYLCRLSKQPRLKLRAIDADLELNFLCPDAFSYDIAESEENKSSPSFDFSAGGNAEAIPVYEITASNAGTSTDVKLKNTALDKEIVWNGTWTVGNTLKIDCIEWTIKLNNIINMNNVSGQFPMIKGGVSNNYTLSGMTGAIKITYRSRYL